MELKIALEDGKRYRRHKARVFRIIMGQCSAAMRNKLEALPEYKQMERDDDVKKLLDQLQAITYSTESTKYEYWSMATSMKSLILMKQSPQETMASYSARLLAQIEVTEGIWGPLIPACKREEESEEEESESELTDEEKAKREAKAAAKAAKAKERHEAEMNARANFQACLLLAGADRTQHKGAVDNLLNDHLTGKAPFPADVPAMLTYLNNRRGGNGANRKVEDIDDGIGNTSFLQRDHRRPTPPPRRAKYCSNCGKKGHKPNKCPDSGNNSDDQSDDGSRASRKPKTVYNWHGGTTPSQQTGRSTGKGGKNFTQLQLE